MHSNYNTKYTPSVGTNALQHTWQQNDNARFITSKRPCNRFYSCSQKSSLCNMTNNSFDCVDDLYNSINYETSHDFESHNSKRPRLTDTTEDLSNQSLSGHKVSICKQKNGNSNCHSATDTTMLLEQPNSKRILEIKDESSRLMKSSSESFTSVKESHTRNNGLCRSVVGRQSFLGT